MAIHFKGSGFYTTDYGKGSGRRSGAKEPGSDGSPAGGESSSGDGDSAKTEKKASGEGKSKETQKAT